MRRTQWYWILRQTIGNQSEWSEDWKTVCFAIVLSLSNNLKITVRKKGLWQSQYGEPLEGQMRELQSTRVFVTLSGWMYVAAALRRAEWSFQRATQSKANNATAEQRRMNILMQPLCYTTVNQMPGAWAKWIFLTHFQYYWNINERS